MNDSIDNEVAESDLGDAPEAPRRKKKGLATNADLMAFLDEEEKEAFIQEFDNKSVQLLSLPFTDSQDESPSEVGYQSMPIIPRSTRMSAMLSEAEPGHHSMPTLSHPTLATSDDHYCRGGNPNNKQKSAAGQPPHDVTESGGSIATGDLETKRHHLQLRKAALIEECNHVSESIMKKRARAQMSTSQISTLESQMRELQEALDKEKKSLDFAKGGIRLHEEILAEHEAKIKSVDHELNLLEMAGPPTLSSGTSSSESGTSALLKGSSSSPSSS